MNEPKTQALPAGAYPVGPQPIINVSRFDPKHIQNTGVQQLSNGIILKDDDNEHDNGCITMGKIPITNLRVQISSLLKPLELSMHHPRAQLSPIRFILK